MILKSDSLTTLFIVSQRRALISCFYFGLFICLLVSPVVPAFSGNMSCQGKTFKQYFDMYSENIDMQKRFTFFPLTIVRHQESRISHDHIMFEGKVSRAEARFPLVLNKRGRKMAGLDSMKIEKKGNFNRVVSIYKADTDYQISLYFSLNSDQCWYLSKIDTGL